MTKIVFLDRESLIANVRQPQFPHQWFDHSATDVSEVVERLQGAQVAVSNKVPLMAQSLAQLPELKFIAVAATGTNNVDLAYCREHGILVSNIRDYATHSVPEHAFALMLALRRNLWAYREDLARGEWNRSPNFCLLGAPISDLHGTTLGLVGRGSLGGSVAKIAEGFGMRVLTAERKGQVQIRDGYTSFEQVLAEADVLTLHCPLNPQTQNLIGEAELRSMKSSALLINTARGGLVDETALIRALQEGWIAGAGFDVLSVEPPRNGHPLLDLQLPNFILTPHVAWTSRQAMQALADQLIDNIEAWSTDHPRNLV
ncbi:MAG: D-2-hydroxyacid dehydrogenase [Pirellulaceae bacterium]